MIHRIIATLCTFVTPRSWRRRTKRCADVYEGAHPSPPSPWVVPLSLAGNTLPRVVSAQTLLRAAADARTPVELERALQDLPCSPPDVLRQAIADLDAPKIARLCAADGDAVAWLEAVAWVLRTHADRAASRRRSHLFHHRSMRPDYPSPGPDFENFVFCLQRALPPPLAVSLLEHRLRRGTTEASDVFGGLDGAALLRHPQAEALGARLLTRLQGMAEVPADGLFKAFEAADLRQLTQGWPLELLLHLDLAGERPAPSLRASLEGPDGPDGAVLNKLAWALKNRPSARAWLDAQLPTMPAAEARLWRGFEIHWPRPQACSNNLWRMLLLAMAHPQPEQSARLVQSIDREFVHQGSVPFDALALEQTRCSGKNAAQTMLLKLQLAMVQGVGDAELSTHPRWQRLYTSPALVRDALKVRRVLAGFEAIDHGVLMRAILTYPSTERLDATLPEPLRTQTAALRNGGADLLTSNARKQEVNTYYAKRVLLDILDYLQLAESLGRQSNAEHMLDAAGALRPLEAVRTAVQGTLFAAEITPEGAAMLARWRGVGSLLRYASKLTAAPCAPGAASYVEQLREALRQEAAGDAPGWRIANSAQMQKIGAAAPHFSMEAWRAGAQVAAKTLSPKLPEHWTVHDTGDLNDLLNMASEGASSCQNLDGHWARNCGLLGRVFDGSQRLIAFKDCAGKIRARVSLVLTQNHAGQPVLMLTGFYHAPGPDKAVLHDAITDFAKARAAALKVPLYAASWSGIPCSDDGLQNLLSLEANVAPDYWDEAPDYGVRAPGTPRTFLARMMQPAAE